MLFSVNSVSLWQIKKVGETMRYFVLLLLLILYAGALYGQEENDPFKRLDDKFEELSEQQDQNFQDYINRQDAKYKAWVARIEAKWNSFEDSDKKTWVDYSDDLDGKNRVDYDNGTLSIQIIQPADDPDAQQKARRQALNQFQKLFAPNPNTGQVPLKNQIAFDNDGSQPVSSQNAGNFFNQKLGGQFKPVDTFMSNDGIRRIKYRVDVPFVKNHVVRRAQEFLPLVVKNCERFRLNPRLVLALIYTESAFNPQAKSYADAYGLMQLIPRYGARDAYRFLFNQDKMVEPDYLYDPANNIEMGCAYFHILFYKEWDVENHQDKRRDLSICSYNWGPHNVRKKIYKRFDGDKISYDELYTLLTSRTPEETQHYLQRILSRLEYFDVFFEDHSN